ncbi:MAG: aspartate aminotransferase family protein [Alphaproteobacteria bacterium]|nr:MAG: aspartate aminotransferase family protein [Alphaproteobacteria bacterium]
MNSFIEFVKQKMIRYIEDIENRKVFPTNEALNNLSQFDELLPEKPSPPEDTIELLDSVGSAATVASTGGRYFGFVIGGVVPAALGASLLASTWDQNAGLWTTSPVASKIEDVALNWLIEILKLPMSIEGALVTGTTMANFVALSAARIKLLKQIGWDFEGNGLHGAPQIKIIIGEEAHVTIHKAIKMLGLGNQNIIKVPVDSQGAIRSDLFPEIPEPSIICLQAGNVNTGAFDPISEICDYAKGKNTWVHVDGAFGLWASVSPKFEKLTKNIGKADSWATDLHKWLNVPYDSGVVFIKDKYDLINAMSLNASYLPKGEYREPFLYTPELSRRARGFEVWAALRSLGKSGICDMIERNCNYASMISEKLKEKGIKILNQVNLNQVLVHFDDNELTKKVISEIQKEGTCWCGGTNWRGIEAMRISISSWKTTEDDIEMSVNSILKCYEKILSENEKK